MDLVRVTLHLRNADTNESLMGALIELAGHSGRYVTGMNGRVSFEVPAGHYTVTARKGGYATLRGAFHVLGAGVLTVMMHELGDLETSVPGRLLLRVAEFGTGRLIEGASVSIPGGPARLTDGQGWVEFTGLSGPAADVTVAMFGYETRTEPIVLHEGRTTVVEVAMAIDAVVLAPIEVVASSGFLEKQGVYWRIERGWPDRLMTREELVEKAEPRLADAFRSLAGIRVDYRGALAALTTHTGCPIAVYFDGQPLTDSNPVGLNIDDVLAEEVEFAEVYHRGRTPARFPGPCGSVLLWSRERAGRG
ncbi:MAG: carboxypeptidase-like regulatory domain-containing protein [Gemmatimonadota bacterium]|nr:carboxypeptidase-like regulatory domain-containing protein [Gemmatimonadota bacterium]